MCPDPVGAAWVNDTWAVDAEIVSKTGGCDGATPSGNVPPPVPNTASSLPLAHDRSGYHRF
jgi:hypothetical protein